MAVPASVTPSITDPGIYDAALADCDVRVGTEEAYEMTRRLAPEGVFVGGTN